MKKTAEINVDIEEENMTSGHNKKLKISIRCDRKEYESDSGINKSA